MTSDRKGGGVGWRQRVTSDRKTGGWVGGGWRDRERPRDKDKRAVGCY